MKIQEQEWFLIKHNWMDWIQDLTMEQRGEFLTCLFTGDIPQGLLGTLVKSHMEEFIRVNEFRREKAEIRSKKAKESVQSRWDKYKELEYERNKKFTDVYERIDSNTNVPERNTNTLNKLHIIEDKVKGIKDIDKEILSREDIIEKANKYFQ